MDFLQRREPAMHEPFNEWLGSLAHASIQYIQYMYGSAHFFFPGCELVRNLMDSWLQRCRCLDLSGVSASAIFSSLTLYHSWTNVSTSSVHWRSTVHAQSNIPGPSQKATLAFWKSLSSSLILLPSCTFTLRRRESDIEITVKNPCLRSIACYGPGQCLPSRF